MNNRKKTTHYWYLFSLCTLLYCAFTSCTNVRTSGEKTTNNNLIQSDIISHEFNFQKLSESTDQVEYLIQDISSMGFILNLDLKDEKAFIRIKDKKIPCLFNFFYDTDLNSSLELIKLLKKESEKIFYFILPTFSEEYLTFEIIEVNLENNSCFSGSFEVDQHLEGGTSIFYKKAITKLAINEDEFIIHLDTLTYSGLFSDIKL